jgi:hypothetical protein
MPIPGFNVGMNGLTGNRYAPALYSGDFGNCLAGQSPFTITELDILYDAGNKTLVFHVNGTSAFEDEPLLGKKKHERTLDEPC